ncbi:MAG: hypothetical protein NZ765_05430, partial [Anaerolineae bacterium]|nr:hypothetical protein [Anaerolineae bacterium]MDW8071523.1 hypothetical protein [Anaerolineae bacterium]
LGVGLGYFLRDRLGRRYPTMGQRTESPGHNPTVRYCYRCGTRLHSAAMYCHLCGAPRRV